MGNNWIQFVEQPLTGLQQHTPLPGTRCTALNSCGALRILNLVARGNEFCCKQAGALDSGGEVSSNGSHDFVYSVEATGGSFSDRMLKIGCYAVGGLYMPGRIELSFAITLCASSAFPCISRTLPNICQAEGSFGKFSVARRNSDSLPARSPAPAKT